MYYGEFGGQYVPEKLKKELTIIEKAFNKLKNDYEFKNKYLYYLENYVGRPSPLYFARNLTDYASGAKIYL